MGVEPTQSAWKAEVLPLNYARKGGLDGRRLTQSELRKRVHSLDRTQDQSEQVPEPVQAHTA